ncbi:1-aminocyclopropane-1-carboxylate deaminase/D-cysteine desulfhydrase [Falsiroseomonas sp. CW058]|uniref:1-aminocyclopropane-1-carboxylate deaminase/D-cysteine desulfhydrase n=1 Tax=Falsiroseomonas sp. CW058 TaxID=3388664 RepID=UPI003D322B91
MPPRIPLAATPTPYQSAPRLAAALGLKRLHVKREDLAGPALGGNKIRSIELILAEARAAGADTVLTTAASQSNFCRALAGCAARVGLRCRLLLRAAGGREETGNLLLMRLFGAELSWTDATDPWDPAIALRLEAEAEAVRAAGGVPHLVQLPGRTAPLAAAAWALAAEELAADFEAAGSAPDVLALACGSGLTLAGLALGFAQFGMPVRLLGVSVQQPAARLRPWVEGVVARAGALLGWDAAGAMDAVTITDDQAAPGYARPSEAGMRALALAATSESLVLDPAYTGKAMAGLAAAVGGLLPRGGSAAFLHSGGTPTLFQQAGAVAASLGAAGAGHLPGGPSTR